MSLKIVGRLFKTLLTNTWQLKKRTIPSGATTWISPKCDLSGIVNFLQLFPAPLYKNKN